MDIKFHSTDSANTLLSFACCPVIDRRQLLRQHEQYTFTLNAKNGGSFTKNHVNPFRDWGHRWSRDFVASQPSQWAFLSYHAQQTYYGRVKARMWRWDLKKPCESTDSCKWQPDFHPSVAIGGLIVNTTSIFTSQESHFSAVCLVCIVCLFCVAVYVYAHVSISDRRERLCLCVWSCMKCVEAIIAASLLKWPIWNSMVVFLEAIFADQPPGGDLWAGMPESCVMEHL